MNPSDHFSAHAADDARHRPSYPPELFAWLAQHCPTRELVLQRQLLRRGSAGAEAESA